MMNCKCNEYVVYELFMYNFLINSLPYPAFILDPEGETLFRNSRFEKMLQESGEDENDFIKKTFQKLDSQFTLESLYRGEYSLILEQGSLLDCRFTVTPVEAPGDGYYALFVFADGFRPVDNSSLSGERYDFLVKMNHELKTPINSIMGITDMLIRYDRESFSEKQLKGLKIVLKNAKILLSIVNDILDYSKIEVGKINIELIEIPLKKFINNIKDIVTPLVDPEKVRLVVDIDSTVPDSLFSDYMKLQQILLNLLSNAISFTDEGEIRIKLFVKDERLYFQVIDSGSGIPEQELGNIFKAFYQVAGCSSKRRYKGSGLGLNITAKLLSLLEGEIEIESVYGEGTVASFYIPLISEIVQIS